MDKPKNYKFLIMWKNKLDIGDASIYIFKSKERYKELILSFKTIFINAYNVFVMDITGNHS
jgi:hypothetical protein